MSTPNYYYYYYEIVNTKVLIPLNHKCVGHVHPHYKVTIHYILLFEHKFTLINIGDAHMRVRRDTLDPYPIPAF